jgi:hypothetical protein
MLYIEILHTHTHTTHSTAVAITAILVAVRRTRRDNTVYRITNCTMRGTHRMAHGITWHSSSLACLLARSLSKVTHFKELHLAQYRIHNIAVLGFDRHYAAG